MSYDYKTERPALFTESGQVLFLQIRDKAKQLIRAAGCFRMQEAIKGCTGNSWEMLACVDRLVELKEIVEVTRPDTMGQYRIFTEPFSH